MNTRSTEVVRIGDGLSRITRVTRTQVDYRNEEGHDLSIELEECARRWIEHIAKMQGEFLKPPSASSERHDRWNAGCVGLRGALDEPPWAQFLNNRRTRFEFASYEEIYSQLLIPLDEVGWHTFDSN